ncbi:hypothetical protein ASD05_14355 [Variovorax sp. Root434]|nr:hypothetical protein ASD05_14355 [Variovorax sp. Root434]
MPCLANRYQPAHSPDELLARAASKSRTFHLSISSWFSGERRKRCSSPEGIELFEHHGLDLMVIERLSIEYEVQGGVVTIEGQDGVLEPTLESFRRLGSAGG